MSDGDWKTVRLALSVADVNAGPALAALARLEAESQQREAEILKATAILSDEPGDDLVASAEAVMEGAERAEVAAAEALKRAQKAEAEAAVMREALEVLHGALVMASEGRGYAGHGLALVLNRAAAALATEAGRALLAERDDARQDADAALLRLGEVGRERDALRAEVERARADCHGLQLEAEEAEEARDVARAEVERLKVSGAFMLPPDPATEKVMELLAQARREEAEAIAHLVMERCLNKVTGATLAGVIRSERIRALGDAT